MRKDWKDELRNSLENYQATEPEGLWSAVQQGLPASRTEAAAAGEGRNSWRILTPLSLALACAAALLIILLPPAAREGELQVVHVIEPKHDETVLNDSQTLNRLQTDKVHRHNSYLFRHTNKYPVFLYYFYLANIFIV